MAARAAKLSMGVLLGLAGVFIALAVGPTPAWRALEDRMRSAALAARPRPWNRRVVVLAFDDPTLQRYSWPTSRAQMGRMLDAITAAGPRAMGIDLIYQADDGPDGAVGTARLASALAASGKIVLPTECVEGGKELVHRDFTPGPGARLLPVEAHAPAKHCKLMVSVPPMLANAGPMAAVEVFTTRSEQLGGVIALLENGGRRYPNLGLQMASLGEGWPITQTPRGITLGGHAVPLGSQGQAWVSVRREDVEQEISAGEVLQAMSSSDPPRLPAALASRFADRYVLIAGTAAYIKDFGVGAGGTFMPLGYLHAAFLQDLLAHQPIQVAPAWVDALVALLLGLLLVAAGLRTRPVVASISLAFGLLGTLGGALMLARHGWLFGPLQAGLAASLGFVGALGGRLATQDRERALLRAAFGAYVDPAVMDRILAEPDRYLALGGARRTLTVFFSDIQGYTGLSNQLPPEEVIALLREYLEAMMTLVQGQRGRVDKIMGDGIMAVFGDPVPDAEHAANAVAAALAMQDEMVRLVERWTREGKAKLAIRIGIATGEVFVGNIGSRQSKIEYTVLGPTVNLASRLEGKAPPGAVLISEATRAACGERFAYERLENIALKGYAEVQVAYVARRHR
jgi:class 3 adenylate cyclase/CHASE2 domain-containing sensor protein